jgi:diadenosine tetraphosphate (Ap4A) HIT family hydrolase
MGLRWEKNPMGYQEWGCKGFRFVANITRISGRTLGTPFHWHVYPTPREDFLDSRGRWAAIGQGQCRTVTDAKSAAEKVIDEWMNPEVSKAT